MRQILELKGKYNKDCKIFTDQVEESALSTIYGILNHPVSENVPIRIMPDVHDGVDIVIGFTMPLGNMVNPNHIGVDIGCGVLTVELPALSMSLEEIDREIRRVIPMGFSHRETATTDTLPVGLEEVSNKLGLDYGSVVRQIGTLGGGNHYIELGTHNGRLFLSIHSGSRNFGLQVCKYHARAAQNHQPGYSYLTGEAMGAYLRDMVVAQQFAKTNRFAMLQEILTALNVNPRETRMMFDTVHNYIDMDRGIIRKGAISAEAGEMVAIPMNMRDGFIVGIGKGNPDWNYSAPHGAGRIMSRGAAKRAISLEDFQASMEGIYSSSVVRETIDESPFAYKPMDTILEYIKDTVNVTMIVKPILNIKSI